MLSLLFKQINAYMYECSAVLPVLCSREKKRGAQRASVFLFLLFYMATPCGREAQLQDALTALCGD